MFAGMLEFKSKPIRGWAKVPMFPVASEDVRQLRLPGDSGRSLHSLGHLDTSLPMTVISTALTPGGGGKSVPSDPHLHPTTGSGGLPWAPQASSFLAPMTECVISTDVSSL